MSYQRYEETEAEPRPRSTSAASNELSGRKDSNINASFSSLVFSGENQEAPAQADNRFKAILCMNLFCIGATCQSVIYKIAAARGFEVIDYQVFRNLTILTISSMELFCGGRNPIKQFPYDKKHTLLWRCITGQLGFFLFNFCLSLIPLSYQMIIFQTAPFWTSILAFFTFAEPIFCIELVGMVVCFAGMITITLGGSTQAQGDEGAVAVSTGRDNSAVMGYCIMIVMAWVYAANCVLNRALKEVHSSVVMFWHGVCGLSIAGAVVLLEWAFAPSGDGLRITNYDGTTYACVIGACFFDAIAVNTVTMAFQSDSSGFVSLISYLNIIYGFLADSLLFHETFQAVQLVAAITILVVTVSISVVKIRQSNAEKKLTADAASNADDEYFKPAEEVLEQIKGQAPPNKVQ